MGKDTVGFTSGRCLQFWTRSSMSTTSCTDDDDDDDDDDDNDIGKVDDCSLG